MHAYALDCEVELPRTSRRSLTETLPSSESVELESKSGQTNFPDVTMAVQALGIGASGWVRWNTAGSLPTCLKSKRLASIRRDGAAGAIR